MNNLLKRNLLSLSIIFFCLIAFLLSHYDSRVLHDAGKKISGSVWPRVRGLPAMYISTVLSWLPGSRITPFSMIGCITYSCINGFIIGYKRILLAGDPHITTVFWTKVSILNLIKDNIFFFELNHTFPKLIDYW